MSDDGTYEYLLDQGVPCERFDTNGSFHLHNLQKELLKHIKRIAPDWVCYCGADLFYIFDEPIKKMVERANKEGYNQIQLPCYNAVNTGEIFGTPLQLHFVRGGLYRHLIMISKYCEGFDIHNDNIGLLEGNSVKYSGIMINYGGCKPIKEQEVKFKRREKAWRDGLPAQCGKHFKQGKSKQWVFKNEETIDLSETEAWKYIKKIQYL